MTLPRTLTLVRSRDEIAGEIVEEFDRLVGQPFTPTRERPCPEMLPRGVRLAGCFDQYGNPIVYAVQSNGRLAYSLPWREGERLEDIEAILWDMLDAMDPLPIPVLTRFRAADVLPRVGPEAPANR